MKKTLRFALASAMALCLTLGLIAFGEAAGKGKPPQPPPAPADPAIAFWIDSPSTGTWGDMMVMDADGSNQTVGVQRKGSSLLLTYNTEPRYVASYLLRRHCLMGLREIGERVGLHYRAVGNAIRQLRERPLVSQINALRSFEAICKNQ